MRLSSALPLTGQLLLLLGANAQLLPAPFPPYTTYLGCYSFVTLRSSGTFRLSTTTTADPGNPEQCQAACGLRGAPYVAMLGTNCYCQDRSGTSSLPISPVADSTCSTPCQSRPGAPCGGGTQPDAFLTIYGRRNLVPQPSVGYLYIGCYESAAFFTKQNVISSEPLTYGDPLRCQRACNNLGSPYLYMEDEQCVCFQAGQSSVSASRVSDDLCYRSCSQNRAAPCGGGVIGQNPQYGTAYGNRGPLTPAVPQRPYNYLGCFQDTAVAGATFESYPDFGGLPADCQEACNRQGSSLMYMFRGECRCLGGITRPGESPFPDEECNIACSEVPSVACGGFTSAYRERYTVYGDDSTLPQGSSSSSSSTEVTSSSTSSPLDSSTSTISTTSSTVQTDSVSSSSSTGTPGSSISTPFDTTSSSSTPGFSSLTSSDTTRSTSGGTSGTVTTSTTGTISSPGTSTSVTSRISDTASGAFNWPRTG